MANLSLNIAREYSRCPGARYETEGDYSGERFREELLLPRLKNAIAEGVRLEVVLDGSAGYSTSFIEEAFGGLIRKDGLTLSEIQDSLLIVSDEDPTYKEDIKMYLQNAWEHRS
jgi:hypothetical protein